MRFTPAQFQAIQHARGHLQIVACAGAGKTEVLANRIAILMDPARSEPLAPANLVAFTFTKRAAAELKSRVIRRCTERWGALTGLAEMFVGTMHSFCLELLRTEVPELLKFEMLNEVQQPLLINRYSKKSGLTISRDLKGEVLRRYRDTAHYVNAMGILREADLDARHLEGATVREGLVAYQRLLQEKRYFDFPSALLETADRLHRDQALRRRIAARVRHVIVDEYQDLNPLQERIVRLLGELGAQICVVGDDDQTIYQWRGSDVRHALTFQQRYATASVIRLQENFRSSPGILSLAQEIIAKNTERLAKAMVPASVQVYEPGDICALELADPDEEARFIARKVQELHGVAFRDGDGRKRGLAYSDMAVLLRSVKRNAEPIVRALREAGVPVVVGGMGRLFDAPEARAARALFHFMAGREDVPIEAVRRCWLDADLGLRRGKLKLALENLAKLRRTMPRGTGEEGAPRWAIYNLQRVFMAFLQDLEIREELIPGQGRGEVAFYNLGRFSQVISDFEAIHFRSPPFAKYQEFAGFLQYQAEDAYPEAGPDEDRVGVDAVRVTTVHQAKGMEWPVVFLPALLRNRFPTARVGGRSVWHLLPKEAVPGAERYRGTPEDERRLFYVAVTRSQKFLFMSWAPVAGSKRYKRPSEFFAEARACQQVLSEAPSLGDRPRLKPERRARGGEITLSFSDLKYFLACPYQFKMRVLYGFNASLHEALGYGKSLHDALAEVHVRASRGDIPTAREIPALVARHLHLPYAYESLKETLAESARKVLKAYFQTNRKLLAKVVFAEKPIELHLDGGVTVTGRIDLVRRRDTDRTTIVELKSRHEVAAEPVTDAQLHLYALGYRALTGRDADTVGVVNLEKPEQNRPKPVDLALVETVRSQIGQTAQAMRTNAFPTEPSGGTCDGCDFARMCRGCGTGTAPGRAKPSSPSSRRGIHTARLKLAS